MNAKATIRLRNSDASLGGYNTARFVQNGGTFNYGGSGFLARFEDNHDGGQIVLKGGEFNASANWSIPHWIPLFFKDGAEGGWTLNQADGTAITWTTALLGDGDVTLSGETPHLLALRDLPKEGEIPAPPRERCGKAEAALPHSLSSS